MSEINLKIKRIEIVLEDTNTEQPIDNVVLSFENNMWRISGPIYPKYTHLMSMINEFIWGEKKK